VDKEGTEIGAKVFLERKKLAWQLKPKTFSLKPSNKQTIDHSLLEITQEINSKRATLEVSGTMKGPSNLSNATHKL